MNNQTCSHSFQTISFFRLFCVFFPDVSSCEFHMLDY